MQSRIVVPTVVVAAVLGLFGCSSSPSVSVATPTSLTKPRAGSVFVVGGEVSGLRGIGLTLKNARGHEVHINNDGAFIFNESVEDKSDYVVTIEREPIAPVQSCAIENARGKVAGKDAMTISIRCQTSSFEGPPPPPPPVVPSGSSIALLEAVR